MGARRGLRDRGLRTRREARCRVRALGRRRSGRVARRVARGRGPARALRQRARRALAGGRGARGTGTLEGTIALEPRGSEGFGYDPIFVPDGESRTVAELGNDWKREHSHRALAARALNWQRSCESARAVAGEAHRRRRSSSRLAAPAVLEPPVELGAEHEHVRHHVEPGEQIAGEPNAFSTGLISASRGQTGGIWNDVWSSTEAKMAPGSTSRKRRRTFVREVVRGDDEREHPERRDARPTARTRPSGCR